MHADFLRSPIGKIQPGVTDVSLHSKHTDSDDCPKIYLKTEDGRIPVPAKITWQQGLDLQGVCWLMSFLWRQDFGGLCLSVSAVVPTPSFSTGPPELGSLWTVS